MPEYHNVCKVCGAEIITRKSNKLVCSQKCRDIADRNYAREHMRQVRKGFKNICIRCKQEFMASKPDQAVCLNCLIKSKI